MDTPDSQAFRRELFLRSGDIPVADGFISNQHCDFSANFVMAKPKNSSLHPALRLK